MQRSVHTADRCRCLLQWPAKKLNSTRNLSAKFWLLTPTLNQFEPSDFENYFEEEKEQQQQKQASAEIETQAATSGGLPTWEPPQVRNTNIHPLVGPAKGVKKSDAPHIRQLTTVGVDDFHRNFSSAS